jgi:hypothetical protein
MGTRDINDLNMEQEKIVDVLATRMRRVQNELSTIRPDLRLAVVDLVIYHFARCCDEKAVMPWLALKERLQEFVVDQKDGDPSDTAPAGYDSRPILSPQISLEKDDPLSSLQPTVIEIKSQEPDNPGIEASLERWMKMQEAGWSDRASGTRSGNMERLSEAKKRILEGHGKSAPKLDLSACDLTIFPSMVLAHMPYLEEVNLSNNRIQELPPNGFPAQSKLKTLKLNYNQITAVPKGSLSHLSSLTTLHLDYNKIKQIDKEGFAPLKELEVLYLGFNKIEELLEGTFCNQTDLRLLEMQCNFITAVYPRSLEGLWGLETLNLSKNQIEEISDQACDYLIFLKKLFLADNKIQSIPTASHKLFKTLETLGLDGNDLENISSDHLAGLNKLRILRLDKKVIDRVWGGGERPDFVQEGC